MSDIDTLKQLQDKVDTLRDQVTRIKGAQDELANQRTGLAKLASSLNVAPELKIIDQAIVDLQSTIDRNISDINTMISEIEKELAKCR